MMYSRLRTVVPSTVTEETALVTEAKVALAVTHLHFKRKMYLFLV